MKLIKSAIITVAGDPSVGIPHSTFELTGGDFILDPSAFSDSDKMVSEFRDKLTMLSEEFLGDGQAHVFLEGWDEPPEPDYDWTGERQ